MFEDLKRKYIASFEDKMNSIHRALESGDIEVLYTSIHQLAGSAGSYGFDQLSELCLNIEQLLSDQAEFTTLIAPKVEALIKDMKQIKLNQNL